MKAGITRRSFVAALPALAHATDLLPSESKKVRDPATEFGVAGLASQTRSQTRGYSRRTPALSYRAVQRCCTALTDRDLPGISAGLEVRREPAADLRLEDGSQYCLVFA